MRRRGGASGVAALLLVLLAGCSDPAVDPSSEAFTGPLSNNLAVSTSSSCHQGKISAGDHVTVTGVGFSPRTAVDLRWVVDSTDDTGLLKGVVADDNGTMMTSLKIRRSMAQPGKTLAIQAEGQSESGLMMLAVNLDVGRC